LVLPGHASYDKTYHAPTPGNLGNMKGGDFEAAINGIDDNHE